MGRVISTNRLASPP